RSDSALPFRPAIPFLFALLNKIKRGKRDIDEPLLDQLTHISEEKCQDQRPDVATIHIGVSHDDDLMVTQLVQVQRLGILGSSKRNAQRGNDVLDFLVVVDLVLLRLLDIENLSPQWQDCLERPVAPLLGRPTRRITLYQV